MVARSGESGRIFVSVVETSPVLSGSGFSGDVMDDLESLTWRFLVYDPLTADWLEMPGDAGGYFWVAPDAQSIVYHRDGALWLRVGPDKKRCLSKPSEQLPIVYQGAWSPDGKKFAFSYKQFGVGGPYGRGQTWLVEVDGGGRTRLPIPATDGVRDWSPDGEWLLTSCIRSTSDQRQMYLTRRDGTGRRKLATDGACTEARFSPDGRQLASTRGPRRDPPTPLDPRERGAVWLKGLDGSDDRMVFGDPEICCQGVRWSPDSARLAFHGFERIPGSSPGAGKLDLSRPIFASIDVGRTDLEQLCPPEPFQFVKFSSLDWR